ncbi:hypothetical protein OAF74_01735, partial [bacterium]|nr:hypothetical protein [bacterium]
QAQAKQLEELQQTHQLQEEAFQKNQECLELSFVGQQLDFESERKVIELEYRERTSKLHTDRNRLEQEISEWDARKTELIEQFELSLQQKREELDTQVVARSQAIEEELRQAQRSLEEKLVAEKEILLRERRSLRDELSKELEEDKNALKAAWQEHNLVKREQERLNDEWSEQRTVERSKIFAEMEDVKKEKLSALDQREKNLQRREIDLQKRSQLHEIHLQRVRDDLKSQKTENEKQRQQQQVWKEEVERGIRHRLSHMKRFRDLMTQREECLADEQKIFLQTRRTIERDAVRAREQFLRDRESWQQQQTLTAEHLKNQEMRLREEYVKTSESHQRVAELADELEEIIHKASISSSDYSPQTTRHLNGLLGILGRQKREADESIQSLQQQLLEMRTEGAELSSWVEERDDLVSQREQQFRESIEALETREEEFAVARDEWNQDRMQAEHVIRELVVQLEIALDQIARQRESESSQMTHSHGRNAA